MIAETPVKKTKKSELEGDVFPPKPEAIGQTYIPDWEAVNARSQKDLTGFWAERAGELEWYKPWDKVLDDSKKPFYQWFVGGKVNIIDNCLDRHVKTWRRNKLALIWEGEPGDQRSFSYHALNREVSKFANVLKAMGIQKGDRVTIYLPRIPELVISMLACAKIGAIHSVVYGGFSVEVPPRAHPRLAFQDRHHRRRRLVERQDRQTQGHPG